MHVSTLIAHAARVANFKDPLDLADTALAAKCCTLRGRMKAIFKLLKIGLALVGALLLLAIIAPIVLGTNPFAQTDKAYCVVVQNVGDFTGEYLKYRQAVSAEVVKTADCEAKDKLLDAGDGKKSGKVRWAVCPRGPDCNEAGQF